MVVEVEEGEDGGASVSGRVLMEGVWWVDGLLFLRINSGLHGSDGSSCRSTHDLKLVSISNLLSVYLCMLYAPD